jgi:2-polyprenyl-3-methyl-5-hydroxy-6-metoxy-1,4-benzoquinol methylase
LSIFRKTVNIRAIVKVRVKIMNKEMVKQQLSEPNGSEKLMADVYEAFDYAWELYGEGFASACSFLTRCAKKKEFKQRIQKNLTFDRSILSRALLSDDAKLRKNTARLIGQLQDSADVQPLIEALACEKTLFVRPSIILALGSIGTNEAKQALDKCAEDFSKSNPDIIQNKHLRSEHDALRIAMSQYISLPKHIFTQLEKQYTVLLRTQENLLQSLKEELLMLEIPFGQNDGNGIRLKTSNIKEIYKARCFTEMLFPMAKGLPVDGVLIAQKTGEFMRKLLCSSHSSKTPFGYRIEIRGSFLNRGKLTKEIVAVLDDEILVNAPSNYEVQLILEQVKGGLDAYVKLHTIPDDRFSYRIKLVSASIKPTIAAAVLRHAEKLWAKSGYKLTKDARILDPFCGSGTFLIERSKLMTSRNLTGVDNSYDAIAIARENTKAAQEQAAFLCKDFLDYIAEEPFDELITKLPFDNRDGTHDDNILLYEQVLYNITKWVRPGGAVLLYTMEFTLLRRLLAKQKKLRLLSEINTNAGDLNPSIFVLRVL